MPNLASILFSKMICGRFFLTRLILFLNAIQKLGTLLQIKMNIFCGVKIFHKKFDYSSTVLVQINTVENRLTAAGFYYFA